jgi:hypothetical protein
VIHLEKAIRAEPPTDEPYYHQDVCRALGMLGGADAARVLLEALRDGIAPLRHASITPLAGVARDRANPHRATASSAIIRAARQDPDHKVAEQAASALLWMGVDGPAFFRMLETDPDPKVRARAARVANRHYLTPARLKRLRAALAVETAPDVQAALQETLASQGKAR